MIRYIAETFINDSITDIKFMMMFFSIKGSFHQGNYITMVNTAMMTNI